MNVGLAADLEQQLADLRAANLHRHLRRIDSPQGARITLEGGQFLNFSSNDYLGLANDPALKEAAVRAIERYGAGAGASRLICGSLAPWSIRWTPAFIPSTAFPIAVSERRAVSAAAKTGGFVSWRSRL